MAGHRDVRKMSFTGSTRAGRELGRIAADRMLPLTLELGGKSANIVFADADLDAAAKGCTTAFTWNGGQWCAAGTRLLVQSSIHDAFVDKLLAAVACVRAGPDPEASYGPMTTRAQFDKVQESFDLARRLGLVPAIGGRVAQAPKVGEGWFIEPTVGRFSGSQASKALLCIENDFEIRWIPTSGGWPGGRHLHWNQR